MPENHAAWAPELAVSVKDFERRPGASKELSISFAAPADLSAGVVGVPPGSPARLDLLLESVLEGVLATGAVRADAAGECGRCLAGLDLPVEATFQELFVYPERAQAARQAGQAAGGEQPVVVQDTLDLNPQVRDAVVLALPFTPLCRDDCPGLC
ncbi:MAG: YceD family protein, partial [Bifidobacteriaceae bacterium]|nr:YceD family protein [Bifidobacteriaceae bacterium]